jgi:hypothetical protein
MDWPCFHRFLRLYRITEVIADDAIYCTWKAQNSHPTDKIRAMRLNQERHCIPHISLKFSGRFEIQRTKSR